MYIGSFWSVPFLGQSMHHDLFLQEEVSLLRDLYDIATSAIEVKLALVRQHAIRVLLHAEIVSEYVKAFRKAHGVFVDSNALWADIVAYPERYVIHVCSSSFLF